MLNVTRKEQTFYLVGERKRQLKEKKDFYHRILQKKVSLLRVESKTLDELKAAIAKRGRRVGEIKDYLQELRQVNFKEEFKKQAIISSLMNRNLEFKVLSGLEIITKLE